MGEFAVDRSDFGLQASRLLLGGVALGGRQNGVFAVLLPIHGEGVDRVFFLNNMVIYDKPNRLINNCARMGFYCTIEY